jgi:hypothetical protein
MSRHSPIAISCCLVALLSLSTTQPARAMVAFCDGGGGNPNCADAMNNLNCPPGTWRAVVIGAGPHGGSFVGCGHSTPATNDSPGQMHYPRSDDKNSVACAPSDGTPGVVGSGLQNTLNDCAAACKKTVLGCSVGNAGGSSVRTGRGIPPGY